MQNNISNKLSNNISRGSMSEMDIINPGDSTLMPPKFEMKRSASPGYVIMSEVNQPPPSPPTVIPVPKPSPPLNSDHTTASSGNTRVASK